MSMANLFLRTSRPFLSLYNKIAEPRVARVLYLGFYTCLFFYGLGLWISPPTLYENVLGQQLVFVFSLFMCLGGVISMFAILPGIWFMERVGLTLLIAAMLVYLVVVFSVGLTPISVAIPASFLFIFAIRWTDINWAQLAPRKE